MSGWEWDDNGQWDNALPPTSYDIPVNTRDDAGKKWCMKIFFTLIISFVVFKEIVSDFIFAPTCHDSPSGSAMVLYQREPNSFDAANLKCDAILSGGKVVSIIDEKDYDFIKKVKTLVTSTRYYKLLFS